MIGTTISCTWARISGAPSTDETTYENSVNIHPIHLPLTYSLNGLSNTHGSEDLVLAGVAVYKGVEINSLAISLFERDALASMTSVRVALDGIASVDNIAHKCQGHHVQDAL